jgi:hypothetical protein
MPSWHSLEASRLDTVRSKSSVSRMHPSIENGINGTGKRQTIGYRGDFSPVRDKTWVRPPREVPPYPQSLCSSFR